MVITKREDVTKQGFCKFLWRKHATSSGSLWKEEEVGVWVGAYLSLSGGGGGRVGLGVGA